ncbi:MAG: XRE family transcriptional regulator [Rhodocyclaceae bacterium]|nr:XRE family transcriptional regulator [Rhodocyclaceae bacterium]
MADKGFRERRVITTTEVASATGINRMTLSKIANHPGYSTVTDNLNRLCNYFECPLGQLAEHIPDLSPSNGANSDKDAPKVP